MPLPDATSSERVPQRHWRAVILGALLIALGSIAAMESYLGALGVRATIADTPRLWASARAQASQLGNRALILVGTSHMQLDLDLGVLRHATQLAPIQLAINGNSSFLPVLEGLADDPTVAGTVLVSYDEGSFLQTDARNWSERFEASYDMQRNQRLPSYRSVEPWLTDLIHSNLRSYADGADPLAGVFGRLFHLRELPQFLSVLPDRSRAADFTKVPMPDYYYSRVYARLKRESIATPALTTSATYGDLERLLERSIDALVPVDNHVFLQQLPQVESFVQSIRARGGRVIFVVLPTSGLIRQIEYRRYPRPAFWDAFVASTSAQTLHFEDAAELRRFECPDGSHLDYRQRGEFTDALVRALDLATGQASRPVAATR